MAFVGLYPPDTVGMSRAANELGLNTKMFGGGMVGLQATSIKTQLGPLLNGVVNYGFWRPVGAYATPEAQAFLKRYQSPVGASGVDALGYYLPPFAYADLQVVGEAVEATHGTDQAKIADYLRSHTFHTLVGDIKFGANGEWAEPRAGGAVPRHQGPRRRAVPGTGHADGAVSGALKAGDLVYPYSHNRR